MKYHLFLDSFAKLLKIEKRKNPLQTNWVNQTLNGLIYASFLKISVIIDSDGENCQSANFDIGGATSK